MVRKQGEKMAIHREDSPLEAILSLKDEAFLKNLTSFPYLLERKEVKEKLKRINNRWKRKIEMEKTREAFWEDVLHLIHLCPRLLEKLSKKSPSRFLGEMQKKMTSQDAPQSTI